MSERQFGVETAEIMLGWRLLCLELLCGTPPVVSRKKKASKHSARKQLDL